MASTKQDIIQHTPGEWTVDENRMRDNSLAIHAAGQKFVADALDFNRLDRDAEVEANARLICAVPELFAACARLITNLDEGHKLIGAFEQIRVALAKVKGT